MSLRPIRPLHSSWALPPHSRSPRHPSMATVPLRPRRRQCPPRQLPHRRVRRLPRRPRFPRSRQPVSTRRSADPQGGAGQLVIHRHGDGGTGPAHPSGVRGDALDGVSSVRDRRGVPLGQPAILGQRALGDGLAGAEGTAAEDEADRGDVRRGTGSEHRALSPTRSTPLEGMSTEVEGAALSIVMETGLLVPLTAPA